MHKFYAVREGAPLEVRRALAAHSPLAQDLLFARGIFDADAAEKFLRPHFERDSHDPFLLTDMDAAVGRIIFAIRNSEPIAVWSDYDCDGIPGGVMLAEFLRDLGGRITHYIPDRHNDGFGLNEPGLAGLAYDGARVVITVDCGTTDIGQAAFAKKSGIDLIITDHHLPLTQKNKNGVSVDVLPRALVINPYRVDSRYPFRDLCGAGVAWKLMQAILAKDRFGYGLGKEKWLLDLVGLATLSDMVPLVGENRMLASYGLLVMRKNRRLGLRALFTRLRIDTRTLSEDDVTFMIAPRINAASRLDKPQTAARLLAAREGEEAAELALALNAINDERKGLVAATLKDARKRLAARGVSEEKIIVVGSPHWRPGILGLVAQKLAEENGIPAFVWGRGGSDSIKGSCRSGGGINVVELMAGAKNIFSDYGGHDFSGGFSLDEARVHELKSALAAAYEKLSVKLAAQEVPLDRQLNVEEAPHALADVRKLSPFGEGNKKPLFLFPGVSIAKTRMFGKAGDHLELVFEKNGASIPGVSFFSTPDSFQKKVSEGVRADVVAHLDTDWRSRPRLRVVDVL
ncbi:MAG: single-stranded-DNA-specific exonuclease RecJ [Minisyncoccia bacterium]